MIVLFIFIFEIGHYTNCGCSGGDLLTSDFSSPVLNTFLSAFSYLLPPHNSIIKESRHFNKETKISKYYLQFIICIGATIFLIL